HRGGEGRSDAMTELAGIGEVLHHRYEAEHGADDAERRAVDAYALEHLGRPRVCLFARVELHFHDRADVLRLAAVHHELQRLAHERVFFTIQQRLETEQALLAGDV